MNFTPVFKKLKNILKPYEAKMHIKTNDETTYYLEYKHKDTNAKPEMFAAIMIKKNYVSMYYMPVYSDPSLLKGISSRLKKRMQGKSCFNFSDENDDTIVELDQLVRTTAQAELKSV